MSPCFLFFETDVNAWGFWVAVVTTLGAVLVALVTGYFTLRSNREAVELKLKLERAIKERDSLDAEVEVSRKSLELKVTVSQWSRITHLCDKIFRETSAERIMFLRGINGDHEMKFATAVHQIRSDRSVHIDYHHYPVGSDYNRYVRNCEKEGVIFIDISELDEDDDVKELYSNELPPVEEAAWGWIRKDKVGLNRMKKEFMSVSTFEKQGFSERERHRLKLFIYEMQGIFNAEDEVIEEHVL